MLTAVLGINYCFAKLLLSRNCNVLIADIGLRPEAQKLIDEYNGKDGKPRAIFIKTDVTIWDQLTNMFEQADKEFGGADIVYRSSPQNKKSVS
jgi:NAD(P)-dependent dehydrogenase (short-subunit alcohol dehydrogenase family)